MEMRFGRWKWKPFESLTPCLNVSFFWRFPTSQREFLISWNISFALFLLSLTLLVKNFWSNGWKRNPITHQQDEIINIREGENDTVDDFNLFLMSWCMKGSLRGWVAPFLWRLNFLITTSLVNVLVLHYSQVKIQLKVFQNFNKSSWRLTNIPDESYSIFSLIMSISR